MLPGSRGKNALVGTVSGSRGETFRFFLFVNRKPARHVLPDSGLEGGKLANTDYFFSTVPQRGETKAQRAQRSKILTHVKDPICVRQTGQVCRTPPSTTAQRVSRI
jgi:hypothetical protein